MASTTTIEIDGVQIAIGAYVDITERENAREKLEASEEKFRKTFDYSPNSVSITRLSDGSLMDVNEGFENLFGYLTARIQRHFVA